MRADGRRPDQLRPTRITLDVQKFADASAMIDCGDTRVLCAVGQLDALLELAACGIRELLQMQRAALP